MKYHEEVLNLDTFIPKTHEEKDIYTVYSSKKKVLLENCYRLKRNIFLRSVLATIPITCIGSLIIGTDLENRKKSIQEPQSIEIINKANKLEECLVLASNSLNENLLEINSLDLKDNKKIDLKQISDSALIFQQQVSDIRTNINEYRLETEKKYATQIKEYNETIATLDSKINKNFCLTVGGVLGILGIGCISGIYYPNYKFRQELKQSIKEYEVKYNNLPEEQTPLQPKSSPAPY